MEAQAQIYQNRRDVLCDGLERLGWPIERPKASMFVWAKIPEPWAGQMNSFDFAMKLLQEGDVAVSPGGGFGPAGEGYLRLALVENETGCGRRCGRSGAAWGNRDARHVNYEQLWAPWRLAYIAGGNEKKRAPSRDDSARRKCRLLHLPGRWRRR